MDLEGNPNKKSVTQFNEQRFSKMQKQIFPKFLILPLRLSCHWQLHSQLPAHR